MQRVRSDSPYLRLVIASGVQRSPTFRAIVDRLERSDLAHFYEQIGFPTDGPTSAAFGQYDTADALDAGERVHHELFHPSEPTRRLARILTK